MVLTSPRPRARRCAVGRHAVRRLADERGMVSVEAAFAIASIVAVLVLGIGAVLAIGTHLRCVDAARETARIAAHGDASGALSAGRSVAPAGAEISIGGRGDRVVVTVHATSPVLPGVDLGAEAVAVREPIAQDAS